jgi:hypothetical protein
MKSTSQVRSSAIPVGQEVFCIHCPPLSPYYSSKACLSTNIQHEYHQLVLPIIESNVL